VGNPKLKPQGITNLQTPSAFTAEFEYWSLGLGISVTLVAEVPDAGEDHRHFAVVGGGDDFLVAN
jgi:hypothetical protein